MSVDTLPGLIWARACSDPDAVAVRQWDEELTYRDLVSGARELADALRPEGVVPETRVVVCVARGPQLVTAVLGILAAGGAYVPLEPGHPAQRRDMIVEDCGATVAVVDDTGREALADSGLVLVDVPWVRTSSAVPPLPDTVLHTDNAAYALYTSGSTGRPKAVVVSHRSVLAFAAAIGEYCDIGPGMLGSCFATLGFDSSVMELFTLLTLGGTVCLVPELDRQDPARLQRFLHAHRVRWAFLAPALLPLMDPDGLPALSCLIVGGEAAMPRQVERWTRNGRRLLNFYGPTESTVAITGAQLKGVWTKPLPIGRPLPNHRCYILDEHLRPVAPGEPGELCVSGVGLARGYLGRPGLTADRFVPDPFAETPGTRMYRTGDFVTQEPNGDIAFLGRADGQVKINGQRVEVGEIESVLSGHPDVAQAAVEAVRGPDGSRLVAYLTPATAPDAEAVQAFCADRLPSFMVPRRVVRLDALPLTDSGKVDFAALRTLLTAPEQPPKAWCDKWRTPLELAVVLAWSELLGVEDPGPEADFFGHGGDSLLAMRLAARLRQELGLEVGVSDVFDARTLIGLVERLERTTASAAAGPTPGHPPALTKAQRRLWFIDRLAPHTPAYNIGVAERLRGPLDVPALEAALADVLDRHEVLRWRFPDRDGVPHVAVTPTKPVTIPVEHRPDDEVWLSGFLQEAARERLDLAQGPLWRVRLLRLGPQDHVLTVTVHHIVFDGWSLEVLYRDLAAAYASRRDGRGLDLDPLALTYADYASWLADADGGPAAVANDAWWLDQLTGAPPVLDLPRDRERPAVATFRGAMAAQAMPADVVVAVRDLAKNAGVTEYAVLLTIFSILLRRLTGAEDLLIAAPVADRRHPDLDDLVGFFVDTVPVRLRVADDEGFAAHVQAGHHAVAGAMEHRDVPFERLVEALRVPRDLSRNPLVQVMFNMYAFGSGRLRLPGVTAEEVPPGLPGSLFDLTLYAVERADDLTLRAVYNPDLYDAARITELLRSFVALASALTADPAAPVGSASARPADSPLPDLAAPLAPSGTDSEEGLLGRIRATARERPDEVAVRSVDKVLRYREVDALISALATALRNAGVADGDTVAVLGARTVALPAVLLGVLASGGRWLVADPADPPSRTRDRLLAAATRALVVCPGTAVPPEFGQLPAIHVAELCISEASADVAGRIAEYLMPTSGTTGEPQLVRADDRPLTRFLRWYADRFDIVSADSTALLGGLAHDPLLRDAFVPLVAGGKVCVPEQDWLRDPAKLVAWLAAERVTILHLTPQLGRMLATAGASLPDVRLVVFAGDGLAPDDVRRAHETAPRATIVNGYGATETPQLQAVHVLPAGGALSSPTVPIGRGLPGSELHVRTASGRPAAVGELGEVVVRGRNLAAGYLDPARTAARFSANPHHEDADDRLFSTGDLGRYDPAGLVVLAGRKDHQVKVRGHRVELGEVESALAAHDDVAAAVVAVHLVGGENQLSAYAVPRRAGVSAAALRDHLARLLPEYLQPADLSLIPAIPLTPNGKVDRAALPPPATERYETGHAEPKTPTEKLVASVWREILGRPRISATDNFFDIGGHSLAIVAVQGRLTALGRSVDVVELFRSPTVRALAAHLDGGQRSAGLDRADRRVTAQRNRRRRENPSRRVTATTEEETP